VNKERGLRRGWSTNRSVYINNYNNSRFLCWLATHEIQNRPGTSDSAVYVIWMNNPERNIGHQVDQDPQKLHLWCVAL
jgi:hypothetical protein